MNEYFLKWFLFLILVVVMTCADPDSGNKEAVSCENVFLPCSDDTTACCEVTCPEGYYLGGIDSTECLEIVCPPGYYLGGVDSSECLEIVCPPGFYLGGEDSTECILLVCDPYFHQCDTNSIECCPDTISYLPVTVGNWWEYNVRFYDENYESGHNWTGVEKWQILNISPDLNIVTVSTVFNGVVINWRLRAGTNFESDTTEVINDSLVFTIDLSDGLLAATDCQGCDSNTASAFQVISSVNKAFPIPIRQEYTGTVIAMWNCPYWEGECVNFTLDKTIGITQLRSSYTDGYWGYLVEANLIDYLVH